MNKLFEFKSQHNILYQLALIPASDMILQQQAVREALEKILNQCAQESGWKIDECLILPQHVQLVIHTKPSISIDSVITILKKYSNNALFKEFAELKELVGADNLWADGYFVETIGKMPSKDDCGFCK